MLRRMDRGKLRAAAFVLLLAWMLAGPIAKQVLGSKIPWLRDWAMFDPVGLGIIDARFFDARGGSLRPVLSPLLGGHNINISGYRGLVSDAEVVNASREMCASSGPDADIRVITRRATRRGWVAGRDGSENLCAIANPR